MLNNNDDPYPESIKDVKPRTGGRGVHNKAETVVGIAVRHPVLEELRLPMPTLREVVRRGDGLRLEDYPRALGRGAKEVHGAGDLLEIAPPRIGQCSIELR